MDIVLGGGKSLFLFLFFLALTSGGAREMAELDLVRAWVLMMGGG
jgi:hypothetical protein